VAELGVNPDNVSPTQIQSQGHELTPIYKRAIVVLTYGFRIGASLLGIGLIVAILKHEALQRTTESYPDILPSILDGEASGIVSAAIVVLVVTPVATVLTVALGFLRLGDRRFSVLSLIVLAVLGISISLSLFR